MAKFYLLIAVIVFFDLLAVLAGKIYSITDKPIYIALTALGFGLAGVFFALSLKYEEVAIVNVIWIALSIILVAMMGLFIFKEHISALQYFAMGLILFGVVLINIK